MRLKVAVGVVKNPQGQVLIAKRPTNVHLGGFWEFPGGKLENGESTRQALLRELKEELGIQVIVAQSLIKIQHDYSNRQVFLDVWQIENYTGVAIGKEGQQIAWVNLDQLSHFSFPKANQAIIEALKACLFRPIK